MSRVPLETLLSVLEKARAEIGKVIIGQSAVIDMCLITIFSGQHALLEGVPGIGKTLLVRTLGRVLGSETGRIQFTPDLMPADITGTNIFNLQHNQFTLLKGPVFTTFLLADEINRAPAKTQSALLQAMQERQVTIDRETYPLSPDFTVFATQNPIEYEGTYPLPEAQKDRFMMKINMEYPLRDEELSLAREMTGEDSPENKLARGVPQNALEPGMLVVLRRSLQQVQFREELLGYMVDIARKTRTDERIHVGAGPRATQSLLMASRVRAALQGRDYVTPDDIKAVAPTVLCHRLMLRPEFEIEGLTQEELVQSVLREVTVPR